MVRATRSDVHKLRELERQVAVQQRRIEHLERIERQLRGATAIVSEWECDHCRPGWIVHDGDELRCMNCGYLQYL